MKVLMFMFLISLMSCHLFADEKLIRVECKVLNIEGRLVKKFPGKYCNFLADGTRISRGKNELQYLNNNDKIIWSKKGHFHHILKTSEDEKYLYYLGEESVQLPGCVTKFDTIGKIEIATGREVVFRISTSIKDILNGADQKIVLVNKQMTDMSVCDTTHINSLEPIKKEFANKTLGIEEGSLGVFLRNWSLFIVLDKDLKKITYKKYFTQSLDDSHDIQFVENGVLLIYINQMNDPGVGKNVSSVVKYNLINNSMSIHPIRNEKNKFIYQPILGGVQKINHSKGKYLISISEDNNYFKYAFADDNFKCLSSFALNDEKVKGVPFQDAKLEDLGDFLKNYQGLF